MTGKYGFQSLIVRPALRLLILLTSPAIYELARSSEHKLEMNSLEQNFIQSSASRLPALRMYAPIFLAALIYIILAAPLRGWIVDDAAISMAYAVNWASGYGLVSQPGMEPVEGYSNFSWVVILATLKIFGVMRIEVLKAVTIIFVVLSLYSINSTCKKLMSDGPRLLVLLFLSTCSSIITWTTSGLENPLTLLLSCELLRLAFQKCTTRTALYFALIAALLGITRPEGIAYAAFPLLYMRRKTNMLAIYSATVLLLYGAFLVFRLATFGDWVPNTFHAKVSNFSWLLSLHNVFDLLTATLGVAAVLPIVLVISCFTARTNKDLLPPLAFMAIAGGLFALMPPDWMPDARFATAFMPAAFLFVGLTLQRKIAVLALVFTLSASLSLVRLQEIYREPTVPVQKIVAFNQRFELISKPGSSLLMPDIGGALLTSKLRIYDLAGLTDKTIARTLYSDKKRFHDYVFEQLKPTFIKTHTVWTTYAQFERDPRFARDYMPLPTAGGMSGATTLMLGNEVTHHVIDDPPTGCYP